MTRKVRPLLPFLALLVAGCSTLVIDSVEQLRESNKRNIAQLTIGTPRAQVRSHELAGIGYAFLARLAPKYRALQ